MSSNDLIDAYRFLQKYYFGQKDFLLADALTFLLGNAGLMWPSG
jgi:hypothetical protein